MKNKKGSVKSVGLLEMVVGKDYVLTTTTLQEL
jgi:hypothetical protein